MCFKADSKQPAKMKPIMDCKVEDNVPAENLVHVSTVEQFSNDVRGEDTETVSTKIVDEPDDGNDEQTEPYNLKMNKEIGGMAPRPMVNLQMIVKCFGVKIHNKTIGTKAEITKPLSIMKLVKIAKYLFLLPGGNKEEASAQAAEPDGYSEPIPIPMKNL
ncbi:hypothetical protein WICPIJ_009878 [Wickerhamomyces pijperi]|uniref:Uncharacterized protein n=1 Tax=Wickerhamomyces pijperi TaxID=599730 RepID=A0A9P8TCA3_WICPI|nr:hypothetical protein WICPIJ_009878 [Wickerhamomyces pijperi]